jgi:hypothetical protein
VPRTVTLKLTAGRFQVLQQVSISARVVSSGAADHTGIASVAMSTASDRFIVGTT